MIPQFPRQSSRPLSPESYRAAARKLRRVADQIEARATPATVRDKMALTRIIHGLMSMVRVLRLRHDRLPPRIDQE